MRMTDKNKQNLVCNGFWITKNHLEDNNEWKKAYMFQYEGDR